MDNNQLTALANDLLVCYWDDSSAELLALDKVFRGSNRSCAEMAEMLRRFGEEHRQK